MRAFAYSRPLRFHRVSTVHHTYCKSLCTSCTLHARRTSQPVPLPPQSHALTGTPKTSHTQQLTRLHLQMPKTGHLKKTCTSANASPHFPSHLSTHCKKKGLMRLQNTSPYWHLSSWHSQEKGSRASTNASPQMWPSSQKYHDRHTSSARACAPAQVVAFYTKTCRSRLMRSRPASAWLTTLIAVAPIIFKDTARQGNRSCMASECLAHSKIAELPA